MMLCHWSAARLQGTPESPFVTVPPSAVRLVKRMVCGHFAASSAQRLDLTRISYERNAYGVTSSSPSFPEASLAMSDGEPHLYPAGLPARSKSTDIVQWTLPSASARTLHSSSDG